MNPSEGSFILIHARDPHTVCCDEALLVCGLRSLGVPLHPANPFAIHVEQIGGQPVTVWRWIVGAVSADGGYQTGDLIKWWHDPAWLAAHRTHEWAIVRAALHNMAVQAREIRERIPRIVVRQGDLAAYIPANASPAHRAHLIGQVEGRIPLNAVFAEPAPDTVVQQSTSP